ncbi:MAG TPA: hypothetical protein VGQ83_35165 [Polyangia bacterium]|jgi:DMSO reductase family type II enzyme heme b subunit
MRDAPRLVLVLVLVLASCHRSPAPPPPPAAPPPTAVAGPPLAGLTLAVARRDDGPAWRDPAAAAWAAVPRAALLLNRTPPSFATDRPPATAPPPAEAQAVLTGARLYVRLRWDDATENRWHGPAVAPYARDRIYKRPTTDPAAFFDGAAVMLPNGPGWRARFPGLMMGDAAAPVRIFFWRHGDQPAVLDGGGRGAVSPRPGVAFDAAVVRDERGYVGVFVLPAPADAAAPLAFAIWDGAQAQRNGDKFFSPWYRPGDERAR